MAWRSAYLYCPHCNNVYFANQITPVIDCDKYRLYCPNYFCDFGVDELVTIDELMIEPVIRLNNIGLRTRFCCSGHLRPRLYRKADGKCVNTEYGRGYIAFEFGIELPYAPDGWDLEQPNLIRAKDKNLAKSMYCLGKWIDEMEKLYKVEEKEENNDQQRA